MSIANNNIEVFVQPIYDYLNKRIFCVEALIRKYENIKGTSQIFKFLNKHNMHKKFDLDVLDYVLSTYKLYQDKNGVDFPISINFHAQSMEYKGLAEEIVAVTERHEIDKNKIIIELNEFTDFESQNVIKNIEELSACGIKLAVDDFGKGRTNMLILVSNRYHIVKIDRSFITDEYWSEKCALLKVFRTINAKLKFDIVIEGIEDEARLREILNLGYSNIQGYVFMEPVEIVTFFENSLLSVLPAFSQEQKSFG